jgi:Luciferase/Major Facilitator Superfamily
MEIAMNPTSPAATVLDEVATWAGMTTQPTPRGATAIVFEGYERGHVHADRSTLDLPLAADRRTQVLEAGRAKEWSSNWVTKQLAIVSTFPAGAARNRAVGVFAAMEGLGAAAGLLLGGLIDEYISWRCVFLVNVPVAAQPKGAQRHKWRAHARLDREEDRKQDRRGREQPERPGRQPADLVPVHDRVYGSHARGRHRRRGRQVEPLRAPQSIVARAFV